MILRSPFMRNRHKVTFPLHFLSFWLGYLCHFNFKPHFFVAETREQFEMARSQTTRVVLNENIQFAAQDFDKNTFENKSIFPPIAIISGDMLQECRSVSPKPNIFFDWNRFVRSHIAFIKESGASMKIAEEMYQEVGFIEMISNHYPSSFVMRLEENVTLHSSGTITSFSNFHKVTPTTRFFFPFCGYFESSNFSGVEKFPYGSPPLEGADRAVSLLQERVLWKQMFYVAPHPKIGPHQFDKLIYNARRLQIDQTLSKGSFSDIIIPISTQPSVCDRSMHRSDRNALLFSCGRDKRGARFKNIRKRIHDMFNKLNKTDIDASGEHTYQDYEEGFWKSKFCFVMPGDTFATSQATRAMCAGCVPIFIADDFRELPFSRLLNYSSFSLRFHPNEIIASTGNKKNVEKAKEFYQMLRTAVINGTHKQLQRKVEIARDFFNYHEFGSRSPYGAALVSMYLDDESGKM